MSEPRHQIKHQTTDQAIQSAHQIAAQATNLEELKAALAAFDGCSLKRTAKNLVFSDGAPFSRVMIIGEAPGAEEDRIGMPFVGASGHLLDRMLSAIGLDRTCIYMANILPWRPPGNRVPSAQETALCHAFITRHIELAHPDILVCLGEQAVHTLLNTKDAIAHTRGKWFIYQAGARTIKAIAMLRPEYLLRQPSQKKLAWRDLKALKSALKEAPIQSTPIDT